MQFVRKREFWDSLSLMISMEGFFPVFVTFLKGLESCGVLIVSEYMIDGMTK